MGSGSLVGSEMLGSLFTSCHLGMGGGLWRGPALSGSPQAAQIAQGLWPRLSCWHLGALCSSWCCGEVCQAAGWAQGKFKETQVPAHTNKRACTWPFHMHLAHACPLHLKSPFTQGPSIPAGSWLSVALRGPGLPPSTPCTPCTLLHSWPPDVTYASSRPRPHREPHRGQVFIHLLSELGPARLLVLRLAGGLNQVSGGMLRAYAPAQAHTAHTSHTQARA